MWSWIIAHPGWTGVGTGFPIGLLIGWQVFALLVMARSETLKTISTCLIDSVMYL